jgi:hypothetical protein
MIVSPGGSIVVAFARPGALLLVVLGTNLDVQGEGSVDGTLVCWSAVTLNGTDYLVMALSGTKMTVRKLPSLADISLEMGFPFAPVAMAFVKNDHTLYLADSDKRIFGLRIGSIVTS